MICYMGMIKDDEKRYAGFIKAIKAMVATIVEYIGGIEVVKILIKVVILVVNTE